MKISRNCKTADGHRGGKNGDHIFFIIQCSHIASVLFEACKTVIANLYTKICLQEVFKKV